MVRSVHVTLAFALVVTVVPAAAATEPCDRPVEGIETCVGDGWAGSDPDCTSEDSRGQRLTGVFVATPAVAAGAYGLRSCANSTDEAYDEHGVQAGLFTADGTGAFVTWMSGRDHVAETDRCKIAVATSAGTHPLNCPAGLAPPDPGWGHLVPDV